MENQYYAVFYIIKLTFSGANPINTENLDMRVFSELNEIKTKISESEGQYYYRLNIMEMAVKKTIKLIESLTISEQENLEICTGYKDRKEVSPANISCCFKSLKCEKDHKSFLTFSDSDIEEVRKKSKNGELSEPFSIMVRDQKELKRLLDIQ